VVGAEKVAAIFREEPILGPIERDRNVTALVDVRIETVVVVDHERRDGTTVALDGESQRLPGPEVVDPRDVMLVRVSSHGDRLASIHASV
jgi:hypothetical protein